MADDVAIEAQGLRKSHPLPRRPIGNSVWAAVA
jgi:hypothetical protein